MKTLANETTRHQFQGGAGFLTPVTPTLKTSNTE